MEESERRYVNCPECGNEMSAHALLCRGCYLRAGGVGASIYRATIERGESSPRWNKETRNKRLMIKGQALSDRVPLDGEDARVGEWSRQVQAWMDEADALLKKRSQASVAFGVAADTMQPPICHGTRECFVALITRLGNLRN